MTKLSEVQEKVRQMGVAGLENRRGHRCISSEWPRV